jgi:hypothetical protein
MKLRVIALRLLVLSTLHLLVTTQLMSQEGKLSVKSNLPRADVYLENNLVGSTDNNGSLVIDQLPAGTFQLELRKEGYRPFRAKVRIENGKRAALNAKLISQEKPYDKTTGPAAEARKKSRAQQKAKPVAEKKATEQATNKVTLVNPPVQPTRGSNLPEALALASAKPAAQPTPRPRASVLGLAVVSALVLAGAYWAIKSARPGQIIETQPDENFDEPIMNPAPPEERLEAAAVPDSPALTDDTGPTEKKAAAAAPTWKKGFIKALRRKEELWQAGLIPESKQKSSDADAQKPQIIIDLSKEHYHYDEENGGQA